MWNRIHLNDFDYDKVLPYRTRLIVIFQDRKQVGEAYVHNGEWYWWHSKSKMECQPIAWTEYPEQFV